MWWGNTTSGVSGVGDEGVGEETLKAGSTKGFLEQSEMHRLSVACAEVVSGVPGYVWQVAEVDTVSVQMAQVAMMGMHA